MKKTLPLFLLPILLSGCASMNSAATGLFGSSKTNSSQATTSRVAPLVVPPDYALKPTQVVQARTSEGRQEIVLDALFGGPAARSVSEQSVTALAGNAEAGIRSTVGDPDTATVNKGSVTRDIIAAPEGDGQTAQAVIPNN